MTSSHASAKLAAKASPAIVPSRDHQKERRLGALPRARLERVRVCVNSKDRATTVPSKSCLTSCELGAGFGQRPFHPHSRLVPLSSPGVWTNRPVRFLLPRIGLHSPAARHSAERGAFIRARVLTCKSVRVQLLQDQHPQYRAVPVVNHLNRLSKSGSSAGFKTSWKDLTCEAEVLSPDDKIHD